MKDLILFESFNKTIDFSKIEQDTEGMFIFLIDEGFELSLEPNFTDATKSRYSSLSLIITKHKEPFKLAKVYDSMIMCGKYLENRIKEIGYEPNMHYKFVEIDKNFNSLGLAHINIETNRVYCYEREYDLNLSKETTKVILYLDLKRFSIKSSYPIGFL